jgi:hypothetical protein
LSLSAQSLTSSWSRPQNSSSIPCGLVILQIRNDNIQNCKAAYKHKVFKQEMDVNKLGNSSFSAAQLWLHKNRCRTTHQTLTKLPQPQVSEVQNSMGR